MKELLDIMPVGVEIKLGDKIVEVKDFAIQDIPKVTSIALKAQESLEKHKGSVPMTVTDILSKDLDGVLTAISASTGLKINEIKPMNTAALIFLATSVVEVNYDFFMANITPMVESLAKVMEQKTKVGQK